MSERLRQMAEERNRLLRGMAGNILKMHDELLGTNYMTPKPTLWGKLKAWFKRVTSRTAEEGEPNG